MFILILMCIFPLIRRISRIQLEQVKHDHVTEKFPASPTHSCLMVVISGLAADQWVEGSNFMSFLGFYLISFV